MAERTYAHGLSQTAAEKIVVKELERRGYDKYVKWDGFYAKISAGPFGKLFRATGRITDTAVTITNTKGLASSIVLKEADKLMKEIFPEAG